MGEKKTIVTVPISEEMFKEMQEDGDATEYFQQPRTRRQ